MDSESIAAALKIAVVLAGCLDSDFVASCCSPDCCPFCYACYHRLIRSNHWFIRIGRHVRLLVHRRDYHLQSSGSCLGRSCCLLDHHRRSCRCCRGSFLSLVDLVAICLCSSVIIVAYLESGCSFSTECSSVLARVAQE